MKKMMFCWVAFVLAISFLQAQELTSAEEACPANPVLFQAPADPNAARFYWDFCTGDLLENPSGALVSDFINDENTAIADAWRPEGMDVVFDGTNWYGFIMNFEGRNIIRADFGNDLNNVPSFKNLGIVGGSLLYDQPIGIKIYQDQNGNWFGFVNSNGFGGNGGNSVVRINFGSSLLNTPTATLFRTGYFTTSPNAGITATELVYDGSSYKLLCLTFVRDAALNVLNNRLTILDFGLDLSNNTPSVIHQDLAPPFFVWRDFEIILFKGNWHLFTTCTSPTGRTFYRLDFGNSVLNSPSVIDLSSRLPVFSRTIDLALDGENLIIYTVPDNGDIYRINLGNDPTNTSPMVTNLGNLGLLGTKQLSNRPSAAFKMVNQNSQWFGFVINRHPNQTEPNNVNQLVRLIFPNKCNAIPATSTQPDQETNFILPGEYIVNLTTENTFGTRQFYSDKLTIFNATVANFNTSNQCFGEVVSFQNISFGLDENVVSWNWDFGDGNTSNLKNPSHQYTNIGNYQVKLTVNNAVGNCSNTFTKDVRIGNPPLADFRVDSLVCSNGLTIFTDLSDLSQDDRENGGQIVRRQWILGDGKQHFSSPLIPEPERTIIKIDQDIPFSSPYRKLFPGYDNEAYQVSLVITDEIGCTSTVTKQISLREEDAPIVNFSPTSACVNVPVQLFDLSTLPVGIQGSINRWNWKIEGGLPAGSNVQNPLIIFPNTGTYPVKLKVYNSQGCDNEIEIPVQVNPSIQSNFETSATNGIVPLTVRFNNLSSGASSFLWDFDNGDISTAESVTYTFTKVGTYDVKFQAKNEFGCGLIATRRIVVTELPTSLEEEYAQKITLFPNPTSSSFAISVRDIPFAKAQVSLYNLLGQNLIKPQEFLSTEPIQLNIHSLEAGIYVVKIELNQRQVIKRIFKQ